MLPAGAVAQRHVAVTIDDGPVTRFFAHPSDWHRQHIVEGLLGALSRHRAPATVFVIGEDLEAHPQAVGLLRLWLEHGAEIGNHSYAHRPFDRLATPAFLDDIDRAGRLLEALLAPAGRSIRYFRAPFLQDGRTAGRQIALARHLDRRGLRNAPATITLEDWRFNEAYEAAERAEDWAARFEVGQAYLRHAEETIDHFDALALAVVGRSIAHVLLVHANTINRDYLDEVLALLARRDFSFVSLDQVYRDPVYDRPVPPAADGGSLLTRLARADGVFE
jgi:peptidoglycan/xylan/chitin deacetylase (PgdA/CDA1 family)